MQVLPHIKLVIYAIFGYHGYLSTFKSRKIVCKIKLQTNDIVTLIFPGVFMSFCIVFCSAM